MTQTFDKHQAAIRRRAWIITASLHLLFAILIAIEVSMNAETVLDPIFYAFCIPGLLIGLPAAMLFGLGGGHGERVFFGIFFGLPFNVFAYYWIAGRVLALVSRSSRQERSL